MPNFKPSVSSVAVFIVVVLMMQPAVVEDTLTPARPDGNNVNLELELNSERQNRLLYETYAAMLQSHFDLIDTSIQSGR